MPVAHIAVDNDFSRHSHRAAATVAAIWSAVVVMQVGAGVSDGRLQPDNPLAMVFTRTLLANLPLAVYCLVQYLQFARHDTAPGVRAIVHALLRGIVFFLLPFGAFESLINPVILGDAPWSSAPVHIAAYPALYWTFDLLIFAGCFAAALAASIWRKHRLAEQQRIADTQENMALRLALEQQQMRALQAQLEPHFLFNALNAISALVRGERTRDALAAIGMLSALLRHAVAASHDPWSTLGRELAFIHDYVGLQRIRFGERLTVTLPTPDRDLATVRLPAQLLQPLIENAIRHDLERHTLASHINVEAVRDNNDLCVRISNPLRDTLVANPGSGLGLANTRERLALMYGPNARCDVDKREQQFVVSLRVPMTNDD